MTVPISRHARHRAEGPARTFLSGRSSQKSAGKTIGRGALGVVTAGLAFGLVAPAASASTEATPPPSHGVATSSATTSTSEGATYTVEAGDTVAQIAASHDSSVSAILAANDIGAGGLIFPGEDLTIPDASASSADSGGASAGGTAESARQPAASSSSGSSNEILDVARQYVGTPYEWAGDTPAGFDCSGFTQYVYDQVGIDIPRTSSAQAAAGEPVSEAAAEPGDLVWWPGHVGIYTGDDTYIAARNPGTPLYESKIWNENAQFFRVS